MKIKSLTLHTNSVNELKEFYANVLGLKLMAVKENTIKIVCGSSELTFAETSEIEKPFYHFAFNIPQNQFKDAKEWLKKKVQLIELDGEDEFDFKSWNAHSVYFYDPAANIVEFIARHNLKNDSKQKFDGSGIHSISEIGLPVHDVSSFYEFLNEKFSMPLFSGDKKTFTAAGDDEGLFIIVNEGRKWFPDCPEAKIFPIAVVIDGSEDKTERHSELPYKITIHMI